MMEMKWKVLLLALTGAHLAQGLPLRTPELHPHDPSTSSLGWSPSSGWYAALPVLALVFTTMSFLFGCAWCFRRKDCKLFSASVHLPDVRRESPIGLSEPVNNNISEDNNNGPISARELQNIANNNAAAYITSENEERNRDSRQSVVEFEPLPAALRVADPLEHCADWFAGEDLPRNRLQYLREIGRGWFGRVVEGEIEQDGTIPVAVKILNQNATLEDKARFLDESRLYRDVTHENVLAFVHKCLQEDPWILMFELCSMDLQQYLIQNRPKMAILNESGVPLQFMWDVSNALAYLHSRGYLYSNLSSSTVLVRDATSSPRAVLGAYAASDPHEFTAPETRRHPPVYNTSSEVWSLGTLIWEVCAWGAPVPPQQPSPPDLPCPYRDHLYQVMQLCWNPNADARPTSAEVHALLSHLFTTHAHQHANAGASDDANTSNDFEQRWQNLKPNSIPKIDEHIAIVHAPSTSMASHFTGSEEFPPTQDSLSVDMDTAVSRSSSIMSDKDPLSVQIKSESLTNLHGSLEDVRNIYLTHNEMAVLECHQGNISLEERERELDKSDASVDPWVKDLIADSQDDVSYFKDVSDVIKNLDNILNSEATSSSDSSHQASPSRDNLSLDCKKEYPLQSSMVKSPGITNFQNLMEMGFEMKDNGTEDDEVDRDTIGTLSHSFERHSDTTSQHTLENLTPDTPMKDLDLVPSIEDPVVVREVPKVSETPSEVKEVKQDALEETKLKSTIKKQELAPSEVSEPIVEGTVKSTDILIKESIPTIESLVVDDQVDIEATEESLTTPKKNKEVVPAIETATEIKQLEATEVIETAINKKTVPTEESFVEMKQQFTESIAKPSQEIIPTSVEATQPTETPTKEELVHETVNQVMKDEAEKFKTTLNDLEFIPKQESLVVVNHEDTATVAKPIESASRVESVVAIEETDIETTATPKATQIENLKPTEDMPVVQEIETTINDKGEVRQDAIEPIRMQLKSDPAMEIEVVVERQEEEVKSTGQDNLESAESPIEVKTDAEQVPNVTEVVSEVGHPGVQKTAVETFESPRKEIEFVPTVMSAIVAQAAAKANGSPINHFKAPATPGENLVVDGIAKPILPVVENFKFDPIESLGKDAEAISKLGTEDIVVAHAVQDPIVIKEAGKPVGMPSNNVETVPEVESLIITQDAEAKPPPHDNELPKVNSANKLPKLKDLCVVSISSVSENKQLNISKDCETSCDNNLNELLSTHEVESKSINKVQNEKSMSPKQDMSDDESLSKTEENVDNLEKSDEAVTERVEDQVEFENNLKSEQITSEQELHDSTQNMDLIKYKDYLKKNLNGSGCSVLNDSSWYLELPSHTQMSINFIEAERQASQTQETKDDNESTKNEQKQILDLLSPFESPTKSHPTDTYEENSSVVLGSYENCAVEFKGVATMEIPKEELLAFSSNFSEINLETPSPLRDGNFLNEVPDIVRDDLQFDDLTEADDKKSMEDNSDDTDASGTMKHVSPSTPPNSPGIYLASTSQQKYLVDIDLETPIYQPVESDSGLSSLQKEIDLNHIELQISTKLAIMADNENNMNREYSGPLVVEGLVSEDDAVLGESEAVPEVILAGNGTLLDESSEGISLDEECVKALRNELELKLPLAQVAGIEPAECLSDEETAEDRESDTSGQWSLPPPPDLVLSYPAALSPILEETRGQLSAYENDAWYGYPRTESSSSYPEPCNDSTADMPSLPHANDDTYSLHSDHGQTYTINKDNVSSKEPTMSADSLNGSPFKKQVTSPIDDRTYNKDDKISNCERISQVSPCLLSPTTDSTTPVTIENPTLASTLSKTTVPTDAKHSRPTECLSKATSIDSWCSNDTLYNVEEDFEDLIDVDACNDKKVEELVKSASTETLIHDKDSSYSSTHIDDRSKSDTFSPDSITANQYTYTKENADVVETSPVVETETIDKAKSEVRDSANYTTDDSDVNNDNRTENAYEKLPSCSNYTDLVDTLHESWKLEQTEFIRKSPNVFEVVFSPPHTVEKRDAINESPITAEIENKKVDSIEITCLDDGLNISPATDESGTKKVDSIDMFLENITNGSPASAKTLNEPESPETNLIDHPLHSTPISTADNVDMQQASMDLLSPIGGLPDFEVFKHSIELRPQNLTETPNKEQSFHEDNLKVAIEKNCADSQSIFSITPNLDGFTQSIELRPQNFTRTPNTDGNTGQDTGFLLDEGSRSLTNPQTVVNDCGVTSLDSCMSSGEFRQFENSVRIRPQQISPCETQLSQNITFESNIANKTIESSTGSNLTDAECNQMNAECNQTNAECNQTNAECNQTNSECNQTNSECNQTNAECNQTNAECNETNAECNQMHAECIQTNAECNQTNAECNQTKAESNQTNDITNGTELNINGENYATQNFINENLEEVIENSIDHKDLDDTRSTEENNRAIEVETPQSPREKELVNGVQDRTVTEDFLQNEKMFCALDSYLPLLSDIRFTGPATEIMSTSFTQDSPTDPASPECEQDSKPPAVTDIVKDWDSDSDSHSSNSSSGEFIWKDGDGHETNVLTTTHFEHQRQQPSSESAPQPGATDAASVSGESGSGSGSDGSEVEFVPSSWDARAAPAKSSLRTLHVPTDSKKRVVFKRQKYHCVYEYPRELCDVDTHSPAYLPDLSTYCEWDPTSAEEAELGYGQLYGSPMDNIDMFQLRSGIAFGSDYDEDFFVSSTARPFSTLGIMSSSSQFFPGMHAKAPPAPRPPSLDLTTPDSGVEDITPGSTTDTQDFKTKVETDPEPWKPVDSASSSESVSPSSPGGEALGGLRHTRDKLKLDLPPSPHVPSPRHNKTFNFVLEKPKRRVSEETVMSPAPEPTFSTFGKCSQDPDPPDQKIILTDNTQDDEKDESPKVEATDSADEDSGIESSKATLERKT